MSVPVTLKVYNREPEIKDELESVDQINECDLEMNSENLVISGSTDYLPEAKRIKIGKGIFRVRIYYRNVHSISEDGLNGDDSYEIHLWPSKEKAGIRIFKNRNKIA